MRWRLALLLAASALPLAACGGEAESPAASASRYAGPTLTVRSTDTTDWRTVSASITSVDQAQAMARIPGVLTSLTIKEGDMVARGQVIGYVGSTGISTGPHLHYELYRNGVAINPRSVSFSVVQALSGGDLREFKAKLARLLAVPVGGTRGNKPGTDNAGAR